MPLPTIARRSRSPLPGQGAAVAPGFNPAWLSKWFVPAITILLLIFGAEMFLSVRQESQTFDEPAHLYAGYSYWLRSDFGVNPEHPPLVKLVAALPAMVSRPKYPEPTNRFFRADSVVGGARLLAQPGGDALLNHARIAVSVFTFLLGLLVVLAANEMFGQATALFALALFVFDPLILAHGALVGTDMGATCCMFGTVYAFYRYVKRPTVALLAVCAVAAGLALAVKHSMILVFPLLVLLSAVEVAMWRPQTEDSARGRGRYALRLAGSIAAMAVVAVAILWAFYGFRYEARPGGGSLAPPTAIFLQGLHHPAEAHAIAFAERHHLLPEAYLYGLTDVTILSNEGRLMFLFGKVYPNGRWFYFPSAFLIKSTIGFMLLLLLLPFARSLWRSERRREMLFLIVPPAVYFAAAMASKLDIGIRHVLPIMPFLIVLAAAGAVSLARQSRGWAWAVSVLLVLHIASSLHAYPNYLPYSNEFFGGPSGTYRVLSDSNVGWGGGLKALHASLERRHVTDCWFAYSAPPDTAAFQIPCKPLPTFFSTLLGKPQQPVAVQIQGPVFVSSEEISDSFWGSPDMNPYLDFGKIQPSQVIGGEIMEYDGSFAINRIAATSEFAAATTLLRAGKPDAALAHAKQAVALDPGSVYAREMLSGAYAANRQPEAAMREYQTAMQLYKAVDPAYVENVMPPVNPLSAQAH